MLINNEHILYFYFVFLFFFWLLIRRRMVLCTIHGIRYKIQYSLQSDIGTNIYTEEGMSATHSGYKMEEEKCAEGNKNLILTISKLNNGKKYGTFFWITDDEKLKLDNYSAFFISEACNMVDKWYPPTPKRYIGSNHKWWIPMLNIKKIIENQRWHFNTNKECSTKPDSRNICYEDAYSKAKKCARGALIALEKHIKSEEKEEVDMCYLKKYVTAKKEALKWLGTSLHPLQDIEFHTDDVVKPFPFFKKIDWHGFNRGVDRAENLEQSRLEKVQNETIKIVSNYVKEFPGLFCDGDKFQEYIMNNEFTLKIQ